MSASYDEDRMAGCRAQQEPFVSTRCGLVQLTKECDHRRSMLSWYGPAGCIRWNGIVMKGQAVQGVRQREPATMDVDKDERKQ